jgi:adenosine kinase
MTIVVTGSVAFDNIMNFPGYFKDHILPDKVHVLSVSFLLETMQRMRGGAAANIAYSLALMGESPQILATVGDDFDGYRTELEAAGVDTSPVQVVSGEFTASAFITTDKDDNQITGFYPGAMREAGAMLSVHDLETDPELVVVSPDDPVAMARYPGECRDRGIPYVYSPGQQIVSLDSGQLMDGIKGAKCLIGNDYEMEMIASKVGYQASELTWLAEIVITTMGEKGSKIVSPAEEIEIPAIPVSNVADPTGAGDAYVAGVARGIAKGQDPKTYGQVASLAAARAVEHYGTQAHSYSAAEFESQYRGHFGTSAG